GRRGANGWKWYRGGGGGGRGDGGDLPRRRFHFRSSLRYPDGTPRLDCRRLGPPRESFMSSPLPTVRLKIDRRSGHPWIFQKMVEKPAGRVPNGAVVDVEDRSGTWCGRGVYNGPAPIPLR